jgi:acylphosphatase
MVQGVGFRYTAIREAKRLGLTGWIRNLEDGSVEVWAEGDRAALAELRAWLDEGPPGAHVESVSASPREPVGYPDFSVEF